MKKLYLVSLLACLSFAGFCQTTFNYTGSVQTYTVPAGVTSLLVDMQGGKGGDNNNWPSGTYPSQGGNGGRVQAVLAVTPGQVLNIYVGSAGTAGSTVAGVGGYNGGGAGAYAFGYAAGGGGGASDIRIGGTDLANRLLVVGGGGGAGLDYPGGNMELGGAGGGLTGGNGYWDGSNTGGYGGFGGTPTAGGASGSGGGTSGVLGIGGDGYSSGASGGGGGGYYGGGGGGSAWAAGGGGNSYTDAILASSVVHTQGYNTGDGVVIITPLVACSGTIVAGTAVVTPTSGGAGTMFTLSLSGATVASGLTYQWQSSLTGTGSWSNITGATNASYTFTGITVNMYYQCIVVCTASSSTSTSSVVMATYLLTPTCLPTSSSWFSESGEINYGADAFGITGYAGSTLSDAGIASAANSSTGYLDRTGIIAAVNLQQGGMYSSSVTWGITSPHQYTQVWIDFNDDGTFQTSEEVSPVSGWDPSSTPQPTIFNISIPLGANTGTHLMRMRGIWEENSTDIGSAPAHCDPCLINYGGVNPSYWSGDVVDYLANIIVLPPCTGTPTAGNATTSATPVCPSGSFTLNTTGALATGLSFQWQSSTDSISWTNIVGATTLPYSATETATLFYRCIFTCSSSGFSNTSAGVKVTYLTVCYCTPSYVYSSPATFDALSNFSLTGYSGSTINDNGPTTIPSTGYEDRTFISINLQQSGVYAGSITYTTNWEEYEDQVWIDYNDNGLFETTEEVTPDFGVTGCTTTGTSATYTLTIPLTATPGMHRMRVRQAETYNCTVEPDMDPCNSVSTFSFDNYYYGCTRDYMANIIVLPPCSGTPSAGNATTSLTPVCPSGTFDLNITGASATGLTYQWQSSPDSLVWTNIGGATTLPYTTSETSTTYYRCVVTCSLSGLSDTSGGVQVAYLTVCYCTPNYYYSSPATYDALSNFSLTGYSGSTINDDGPLTIPSTGYEDRTFITVNLQQSGVYTGSITYTNYGNEYEDQVWIDYNDNGTFETTEEVTPDFGVTGCSSFDIAATYTLTVPLSATLGLHRMRVRQAETYNCTPETDMDPCNYISTFSFDYYYYGCTRDYMANIIALPPCAGAPTAGSATTSTASVCPAGTFDLNITGTPSTGLTYQWQSSPDGTTWTNIVGATTIPYTTTESATTDYRCVVSCTFSGLSDTSTFVAVSYLSVCYCVPSYTYTSPATFDALSNFSLTGYSGSTINDDGPTTIPPSGYEDRTFISVDLQQSGVYAGSITYTTNWEEYEDQVWIDYNDNGIFETTEEVTPDFGVTGCTTTGTSATYTLTIPLTATPGMHRMRVRQAETYNCTVEPDMDPCNAVSSFSFDNYYYGCTRDYMANLIPLPVCSGTPTAGVVAATDTTGCTTYSSTLTVTGTTTASGLTYQWQSSTDGLTWVNVAGATTMTYSATVATTTYYRFVVTCTVSGLSTNSTPVTLSITPAPGPITISTGGTPGGPFALCYTTTGVTFSGAASGGTWSNTPPDFGIVSSTTGLWTPTGTTGTTTISYTLGTCTATATLNINSVPPTTPTLLTGTNPICAYSSLTLADGTPGGVWHSSDTTLATVDMTGNVMGMGNGIATISYDDGCGFSTYAVTVNGSAIAISPSTTNICNGANLNLTATYLTGTGVFFSWAGPGGTSGTTSLSIPSVTTADDGTYTFTTITSALTGSCTETLNIPILVVPAPSITLTPSSATVCLGTGVSVTASTTLTPASAPLLAQNFNTGLDGQIGGTWSVINTGDPAAYNWAITAPYSWSDITIAGDGSNYIGANADLSGFTTLISSLNSPSFSTVGYSAASLSFNHYILSYTFEDVNAEIDYSTDGGATWSLVANYLGSSDGFTSWTAGYPDHTLALPSGAIGQPNVMLRWYYNSFYGFYWAVDNIEVDGTPNVTDTWSGVAGATGLSCTSCTTTTITPTETGTNVYNFVASTGTCTANLYDTVTVSPLPALITGITTICLGGTSTLADSVTGGTWSSSNPGVATINASTGVVTPVSTGSTTISYTIGSGCPATTTVVIGSGAPATISGTAFVCIGGTTTLTDAVTGGTWSSGATGTATIGSSTGIVTGVAAGTATITYTTGCGTSATAIVTVNPNTAAITGASSECIGATTTLADITTGGTWSSSTTSVGVVGSGTGIVLGVSSGTTMITYTGTCGYSTKIFTVNGNPPTIAGASSVCIGGTTTFTDLTGGGTWSSNNTTIAIVGSSTGVVSGLAPGVDTINYTATCGSTTKTITVNGLPSAISGSTTVCAAGTTTLTDATAGGTWSSGSIGTATIGSSTGVVTGIVSGIATISYTTTCGVATTNVTVNSATPAAITGASNICAGSNTTLTDVTTGGAWSSSATTVATISTSGVLTGVSGGSATISYSTGCGIPAFTTITINPLPSAITGILSLCASSTTALNDSIPGGTWTSGNTSVATILPVTGVVSGVAAGVASITYSNTCGAAYTSVTVNVGTPAGITGATSVCAGSNITLADAVSGGFWSSSSTTTATIIGTSGVLTGVLMGNTNISYTTGCGVPAVLNITVNAIPAAITGNNNVCATGLDTMYDATIAGTWSIASTTYANINSGTGIITGVAAGTTTVTYATPSCGYTTAPLTVTGAPASITGSGSLCIGGTSILTDATTGGTWSSSAIGIATVSSGIVTGVSAGTATVSYTTNCGTATFVVTVNGTPAAITGSANLCTGSVSTLNDASIGGTWTSGTSAIATIGGTTGIVTGVSSGIAIITYSNGCSYVTKAVTVNSSIIISGTPTICIGGATTFTDASTGGTWNSSNPSVASVDITFGVVTGIAAGTATITYNSGLLCGSSMYSVTVNSSSASITGTSSLCVTNTVTLADSTIGGAWTSSSTGVATVNSSTGVVTGVSAGTTTISYSNGCGTPSMFTVTVNGTPTSITAPPSICITSSATLTDGTPGGTWTSSNTAIATITSATGIITGVSVGAVTISYSNGCGSTATTTISVNGAPYAIVGSTAVCTGSNITLTDASIGGTWSSSVAGIATVGLTTGIVSGVTAGTVNITYNTSCGISTSAITVSSGAVAITGSTLSVCPGNTISLADATVSGTWSSDSVANATVSSTGVVTGVAAGTATISYTNGCGTPAMAIVTINPLPSIIVGATTVCLGSNITFTDSTSGGTWSSANTTLATIGSTTGILTSNTTLAGTDVVTYLLTATGCSRSYSISVLPNTTANPLIIGLDTVCSGATIVLADSVTGPISSSNWSSSNISIATIGSTTGVVTGIAGGNVNITYTVIGCGVSSVFKTIFVKTPPDPGTISGAGSVCAGSSIVVASTVAGGVWSSSNVLVSTVFDSLVTGVSIGTDLVIYSVHNNCGTNSISAPITVLGIPATITGTGYVCAGSFDSLHNTTTGGVWSSSDLGTATIDSIFGVVHGVGSGMVSITYSTGCGSIATTTITVNSLPYSGTITGDSMVCEGANISLITDGTGGTWVSHNGNAIIDASTGVVTGVLAGIDTMSYNVVTASCGFSIAFTTIMVNPLPHAGVLTGMDSICAGGGTTIITASATGGTWTITNTHASDSLGYITGNTRGTDTLVYSVSSLYCGTENDTMLITIMPLPHAGVITGGDSLCVGTTLSLVDTFAGGVWISKYPAIASVSGGIVSGVMTGIDTIKYVVTNFCGTRIAKKAVRVDSLPMPGTISGNDSVCIGSVITLMDTLSGGVWNIAHPNATISAGMVTGVTYGFDTVLFTVSNHCGSSVTTMPIFVNQVPSISVITGGAALVCKNTSITFTDSATGGVWTNNNSADTISSTGVFVGTAYGTDTIQYSITNTCGTVIQNFAVAIDTPLIPSISAINYLCIGKRHYKEMLSASPAGGIWTLTNNFANLTADTLMGVTPGIDTIQYTVSNICGSRTASDSIWVLDAHDCDSMASVKPVVSQEGIIKVYPNPNSGQFTVELPELGIPATIIVMDITGKILVSKDVNDNITNLIPLIFHNLANGTYLIKVIQGDNTYRGKVLIIE